MIRGPGISTECLSLVFAIAELNKLDSDLKKAGCVRPTGRFLEARAASESSLFSSAIANTKLKHSVEIPKAPDYPRNKYFFD